MTARVFRTKSGAETVALGERLARQLPPGATVLLVGQLGAGKTTMAKGIVKGVGAARPEDVTSPTFTLIHEYGAPPKVYHIDLYRLEQEREAASLGLEELLDSGALVLVEWGERFPALWPPNHIEIRMEATGDTSRRIQVLGGLGGETPGGAP